jgi:hypothetical protein
MSGAARKKIVSYSSILQKFLFYWPSRKYLKIFKKRTGNIRKGGQLALGRQKFHELRQTINTVFYSASATGSADSLDSDHRLNME